MALYSGFGPSLMGQNPAAGHSGGLTKWKYPESTLPPQQGKPPPGYGGKAPGKAPGTFSPYGGSKRPQF